MDGTRLRVLYLFEGDSPLHITGLPPASALKSEERSFFLEVVQGSLRQTQFALWIPYVGTRATLLFSIVKHTASCHSPGAQSGRSWDAEYKTPTPFIAPSPLLCWRAFVLPVLTNAFWIDLALQYPIAALQNIRNAFPTYPYCKLSFSL